jgi:hypothetical protein
MPDRLPEAVDTLIAEIRDLNGLVRGERRWRRVLAVVVVAVTLLGAYNWWARSDENHQRCTSTNTSRLGIRQAFKTDHDALDGFLASIATTPTVSGSWPACRRCTVARSRRWRRLSRRTAATDPTFDRGAVCRRESDRRVWEGSRFG